MNVNMAREGAKTEVLLRGIHCVNILAVSSIKKNGAQSRLFTDKRRGIQGSYFIYCSPFHAPDKLICKSNISVTERCFSSMFLMTRLGWKKKNKKNQHFVPPTIEASWKIMLKTSFWCQLLLVNISRSSFHSLYLVQLLKNCWSWEEIGIPWYMNAVLQLVTGRQGGWIGVCI